ncbi:hypothetical protein M569_07294 [Genlisea aurea]|uniref:Uncharacterized protein n=1 Tax=Genlisea aurea TaxID=192259 RepID=S8CL65_9LAMI|nr:hypothetical protein M569_07294 [Genlisea aurea]
MAVMGRVLGSILTDSTAPVPIQPGRGLLMLSRQYVALGGRTGFAERTMTTDRVMHSDEDAIIPSYQDVGMYAQIVNQFGVLSDQEDGTYTYTPIETGGLGGGEERPDQTVKEKGQLWGLKTCDAIFSRVGAYLQQCEQAMVAILVPLGVCLPSQVVWEHFKEMVLGMKEGLGLLVWIVITVINQ